MEIMGIGSVAAISISCFIFGLAWKTSPLPDKWIPLLCGVIGGGLGVPAMRVMAEFPAADPITAVAVEDGYISEADAKRVLAFRDNPLDESWINA